MLRGKTFDGGDDEARRSVSLDSATADDMELDATAGKFSDIVERCRQVAGEAIEVINHDRPRRSNTYLLGQSLQPFAPASADAVILQNGGELPALRGAVVRDPGTLIGEADRPRLGFLRPSYVADGDHVATSAAAQIAWSLSASSSVCSMMAC